MSLSIFLYLFMFWAIAMTLLVTPKSFYVNTFDKLTKAKYRADRKNLEIMLDNLRSFPENWSLDRKQASYPLDGKVKDVYLTYDDKNHRWDYALNSFGGASRPLEGYFGKQFAMVIDEKNNEREKQALLRSFYPDLNDGTLRLK